MNEGMNWRGRATRLALGIALSLAASARDASAQAAKNEAAAEALFEQGRSLYEAGRYAEACPKLAESQRIDPATGTLLALALCHEGEQKLASAWAEFKTVEGEARRSGRTDRETIAREHAAAIRGRLSTLSIRVPPDVRALPGLELKLNGTVIGAGSFDAAIPVDGGQHELQVSAAGKKPLKLRVSVRNEAHGAELAVPLLEEAPQPVPASTNAFSQATSEKATTGSPMRTIGLIVAGAGILSFGAGSYLALTAKADYDDAEQRCPDEGCSTTDWNASQAARKKGSVATIVFGIGGALVATGGVLWLAAPRESSERRAGVRVQRVGIGPSSVVMEGAF